MGLLSVAVAAATVLVWSGCGPSTAGGNNNEISNNNNVSYCDVGMTDCGGVCVNILTDTNHCGGCDQPCFLPNVCDGSGVCGAGCNNGLITCDGVCVDIDSNALHCGACNQPCPTGWICENRVCGDGSCTETSSQAESGMLPADIIVVVDNSGSMTEEAQFVQDSMNSFASIIAGSGIDYHVILISADSTSDEGICVPPPLGNGSCPADENLPSYRHVNISVASSNAFDIILSSYSQWSSSLRPNATRSITVITDDNSDMGAANFSSQLIALDPSFAGFTFHSIFAPYDLTLECFSCPSNCAGCDPCCGSNGGFLCTPLPADEGTVYRELVQSTGGVEGNLCTQDFLPAFQAMATSVVAASQVSCVYDIPDPPGGETIDFGRVNVDYTPVPGASPEPLYFVTGGEANCGPGGGWYYDDDSSPTQILFCDVTCSYVQQSTEGAVAVKFGCATVVQ
jgi:Stigma-specific protein, Stig1